MDIRSDNPWPSGALSNFAAHHFEFRGIPCHSMEGLLQSFKFQSPQDQKQVCRLTGKAAKQKGLAQDWRPAQILWWQGKAIPRASAEYQNMLDEAYLGLFTQNAAARKALLATGREPLQHSLGVTHMTETVLTAQEFCSRLTKIRDNLPPAYAPKVRKPRGP